MQKVIILEDDQHIRELIIYALKTDYKTYGYESPSEFWQELDSIAPNLLLLDLMLPEEDGGSVLKKLRSHPKYSELPIIIITAKNLEYDKINLLDLGADDYITKPFSVLELLSRIRAVLRRYKTLELEDLLSYNDITVDLNRHIVKVDSVAVTLTLKEFELLIYLLKNANIVLSRVKIIDRIWGIDYENESRTVDMHIKTLRQKLGTAGESIKTIRGVGYKIGE